MTGVPELKQEHQAGIDLYDSRFSKYVPFVGISSAAGGFLLVGALIVILSASLCLTLPNINVISHVILPGILPGSCALLLSLPFLTTAFLLQKKMSRIRAEWMGLYEQILQDPSYSFDHLSRKQQKKIHKLATEEANQDFRKDAAIKLKAKFITKRLFHKNWRQDYKERIVIDLKNRLPDESVRSDEEKALAKVFDAAKKILAKDD